jgi:ABC-2 type transport system permease protein
VYTSTDGVWMAATAPPETRSRAALAIVDEDHSPLSLHIRGAFAPPYFLAPVLTTLDQADVLLDRGRATFVLVIPAGFQRRVLAGRASALQLNVDATRMSQAFTASGYIREIALGEVPTFLQRVRKAPAVPIGMALRARFNPALTPSWFGGLMETVNNITMLSVILTGAALIREREHGTIEHLLVMPVSPLEIMLAKLWAMAAVVLAASLVALVVALRTLLHAGVQGSIPLFLAGAALHLFAWHPAGHAGARHAAVRHPGDPGAAAAEHAVRRQHPAREHPVRAARADAAGADHPFRRTEPGDPVPRCRRGVAMAAVPAAARDWRRTVQCVAGALREGDAP